MKSYQKKINQDLHYKFLFPFSSFRNPIFKVEILQNVKLKTIRDVSLMQGLILSEIFFSCRPKITIRNIKYRFKESFIVATLQLTLYNSNLKSFLHLFITIYYPILKKIVKKLRYKKLLYYFTKENNIITFLFNSRLFYFIKTEVNKSFKNPFIVKIFTINLKDTKFEKFHEIFQIFVLSRFIKFPIYNYILRKKINKKKSICNFNNILKIISYGS